ncbi:MAG: hypothetical protein KJ600_06635 [Nanoarchaeota archaeon]|nr:hypothetical protein [Nanoarchaeota archaeon]MBU1104200.1 hypothetical protein [Nanoarchaeota archaeon]
MNYDTDDTAIDAPRGIFARIARYMGNRTLGRNSIELRGMSFVMSRWHSERTLGAHTAEIQKFVDEKVELGQSRAYRWASDQERKSYDGVWRNFVLMLEANPPLQRFAPSRK